VAGGCRSSGRKYCSRNTLPYLLVLQGPKRGPFGASKGQAKGGGPLEFATFRANERAQVHCSGFGPKNRTGCVGKVGPVLESFPQLA